MATQPQHDLVVKWQGKEFPITMEDSDTVSELKRKIQDETEVQPKRQKLLGLKAKVGKGAPADELQMRELAMKPGLKIMMMGTPDALSAAVDKMATVAPHIQDDFDMEEGALVELDIADRAENQEKLRRRLAAVDLKPLNPPRPDKKVVVLDIDYTIFDLGSSAERPEELARPHLHEFMAAVYPHYDIVIWSATSMKWVEIKMRELGVTTHPDYKVSVLMDHKSMITVQTEKHGVFDCKPLQVLWGKFPEFYGPENTIMLDDLRRNYVMNKQNGLVIRPFMQAHQTRATDKELLYLKLYLLKIAKLPTLGGLRHSQWQRHIREEIANLNDY